MTLTNRPGREQERERLPGPRTIGALARQAAASSYGVVRVAGPRWYDRLLELMGRGTSGVRVRTEPRLTIQLFVRLAPGVPAAQVMSNVEKAVRYVIQREVGRPVDELAIHVGGGSHGGPRGRPAT